MFLETNSLKDIIIFLNRLLLTTKKPDQDLNHVISRILEKLKHITNLEYSKIDQVTRGQLESENGKIK